MADNEVIIIDNNEDFVYIPVPEQINFGATVVKIEADGTRVLTDYVIPAKGETYRGMPATMADIPQYEADETTTLDDPGSMAKFHIQKRFPVGTETATKANYTRDGHTFIKYPLWRYNTHTYLDIAHFRWVTGYQFDNVWTYSTDPINMSIPTAYVKDLAAKGGYWYKGTKYS